MQDDRKKIMKFSLTKMLIMGTLIVIVLYHPSLSWFTMNKEVEGSGVQMTASNIEFSFEFPGSDEGKWINQYCSLRNQAGIWLVDDKKYLDNGSEIDKEHEGLEPGDSGILEFRVEPNGQSDTISVDLCFSLRGIVKPEKQYNQDGTLKDVNKSLEEITDTTLMNYVGSHIMLFTGINGDGKYTGLLQNNNQLQRYIRNKLYSKTDTEYTKLYWVWPMHLSNIISKDASELIYAANERDTVIQYIVEHKSGFFKGIETEDSKLKTDLLNVDHYGAYSILFDKADLDIGNKVQYVILGMSASTSSAPDSE